MRDGVLWIGIAACVGALFLSAPLAVGIACLCVGFMVRRWWVVALCVVALAAGYARARGVVERYEAARDAVVDAGGWPTKCTLEGIVTAAPARSGGAYRVVVDADAVRCRDAPSLAGRVTLHFDGAPPARGDRVSALASLAPPYRFFNDGTGDPRPPAARRGTVLSGGADDLVVLVPGWGVAHAIDRARARLRERIVATFPEDTAPMARALVLGEDDLDAADSRAFRKSGLAHLLAVSGMHLVLVVMGLVASLRAAFVRIPPLGDRFDVGRLAAAVGVPLAWLYADLAGGSGSAIRAAWMCTVVLLARALGRRAEPWRALGLSLLAMSAFDPLIAYDVSFVLSALATAGLLGLAPPIARRLGARERLFTDTASSRPLQRLRTLVTLPLATTLAATIACAPVLATIAPELALGGLFANLVAVPLGEAAALPLCLLHGLLEAWPDAERGCALTASGALVLVRLVARGCAWATLPVPMPTNGQLAAFAVAAAACALLGPRPLARVAFASFARRKNPWLLATASTLLGLEIATRLHGAPHGILRATFIDVGQGDSALVDLPDGSAILIDAGGLVGSPLDIGDRAVGALLSARRRTHLRAAILSHPHPDHFLGLPAALARASPREFWDTGQGEEENPSGATSPYTTLLADLRARRIPIRHPADLCGIHTIGGATIEILAPCPGPTVDRGANDNSFVLRIRHGARSFLFVGDAEHTEEGELGQVRADVLKVGHHGSRTSSTPSFLARVRPEIAVISCGVRNRFGHPHPTTLEHLEHAGIRVFRTDRDGSVVVATDGQDLSTTPMNGKLR